MVVWFDLVLCSPCMQKIVMYIRMLLSRCHCSFWVPLAAQNPLEVQTTGKFCSVRSSDYKVSGLGNPSPAVCKAAPESLVSKSLLRTSVLYSFDENVKADSETCKLFLKGPLLSYAPGPPIPLTDPWLEIPYALQSKLLKGGYIGNYMGEYYRGFKGVY